MMCLVIVEIYAGCPGCVEGGRWSVVGGGGGRSV